MWAVQELFYIESLTGLNFSFQVPLSLISSLEQVFHMDQLDGLADKGTCHVLSIPSLHMVEGKNPLL